MKKPLLFQLILVAAAVFAIVGWAVQFPYPSPLIKPFLPPIKRWPPSQVMSWVESGNFGSDFLEFFARDPERTIPPGDNVVAPADGLVFGIPRRDGTAYFIVNLSFWDVHVVRSPVAGIVKDVSQEGLYLARTPTAAQMRESIFLHGKAAPVQSIITLDTGHGDIKIRLITSYWASRLKVWVHEGDRLAKGERIGRIVLGSTVAVEFPDTMEFSVQPRQRVVGGETIISKKGVGS